MTIHMIDGVAVPKAIWYRRQIFGEHRAAKFDHYTIHPKVEVRR